MQAIVLDLRYRMKDVLRDEYLDALHLADNDKFETLIRVARS